MKLPSYDADAWLKWLNGYIKNYIFSKLSSSVSFLKIRKADTSQFHNLIDFRYILSINKLLNQLVRLQILMWKFNCSLNRLKI